MISTNERTTIRVTAFSISLIATILLAVALMRTLKQLAKDRKVDAVVISDIRQSKSITIAGLVLIIISFAMTIITEVIVVSD